MVNYQSKIRLGYKIYHIFFPSFTDNQPKEKNTMESKMKMYKVLNVLMLTLLFPPTSFGGNESGGGGNAIVCYREKEIVSAELLDIYEGESIFGDTHLNPENYEQALQTSIDRLEKTAFGIKTGYSKGRSLSDLVKHVEQKKRFISRTTELRSINDSFEVFIPKDCFIKQTVNFINEDTILIDQNIWDKLSERDKAGLIIHEAVYWYSRLTSGTYDSRRSRRIVSKSFEQEWNFEEVLKDIPKSYTLCETLNHQDKDVNKVTAFIAYETENYQTVQFLFLDGDPVISKKTILLRSEFVLWDRKDDDNMSYNASAKTTSLYEGSDSIHIHSNPKFNDEMKIIGNTLNMSRGKKNSYPDRDIEDTSLHCRKYYF